MHFYRNGSKQPKLHPEVNSLIIEFQQTYLIPNGGEASCQTHDNTWILTKDQNTRCANYDDSLSHFLYRKPL